MSAKIGYSFEIAMLWAIFCLDLLLIFFCALPILSGGGIAFAVLGNIQSGELLVFLP